MSWRAEVIGEGLRYLPCMKQTQVQGTTDAPQITPAGV